LSAPGPFIPETSSSLPQIADTIRIKPLGIRFGQAQAASQCCTCARRTRQARQYQATRRGMSFKALSMSNTPLRAMVSSRAGGGESSNLTHQSGATAQLASPSAAASAPGKSAGALARREGGAKPE